MSDRDNPIPTGHTPQHNASSEPRPDPEPPQDQGDSSEFLEQLAGTHVDGTAYIDATDIEQTQGMTLTDLYEGDTDVNQERTEPLEDLDMLESSELREGETDDPMVAIEEGLSYVPPIDPPIVPDIDDPESIQIASGTRIQSDPQDEADEDDDTQASAEDDMSARVRRVIRSDASTSHLADRIRIVTENNIVVLRGEVDDLDDTDNLVAVVSEMPDDEAVRDETTVRGL